MNSCLHNFSLGWKEKLQGLQIADADKGSSGKFASEYFAMKITPTDDKERARRQTAQKQRRALMYDVT